MSRGAGADGRRQGGGRARPSGPTPLRFGLVGTGAWAMTTHAVALTQTADVAFAGVWGRDASKTRALAAQFGVRAYPSYDALLEDVDAVAFAVPPDVQAELASQAAAAGTHVLLEKPAALTPEAAGGLERAVSASAVACLTFFTLRFDEIQRAWLGEATADGSWQGAWALWLSSAMLPGGAASGSGWRMDKGALWDVGPHALSMIVPALGPVAAVYAEAGEEDLTHVVMRHRSGASSTMSLTLNAPSAAGRVDLGLWGDRGVTRMPASDIPYARTLGGALRELASQARSGERDHACDMRLSRHVVDVLYAAESARRQGRPVDVGG